MKKCRKISPQLHALALDEIDAEPAEELMNHLSECPSCSEAFDDFKQMRSLLGENIASAVTCPDIADSVLRLASAPEEAPASGNLTARWTRTQLAAAAAVIVLVIAGFAYLTGSFGPRQVVARATHISLSGGKWKPLDHEIMAKADISTNARERRSLKLKNGVIVILNENTTLKTRSANRLKLITGDVYIDTAGQRGLDFRVKTKHATTHVTGTRFGVSANKERTTVIVEEGEVAVGKKRGKQAVWAGYGYRVARKAKPEPPEPVNVGEVFSWIKERRRMAKVIAGGALSELEEQQPVQSLAVEQDSPVVRIFGIIRDEGGEPVAGAELQAMEAGSGARISGASTTTRSDGSYDLGGMLLNNPVPYKIVASAPGYGPALSEASKAAISRHWIQTERRFCWLPQERPSPKSRAICLKQAQT
jgi:transmembrane sensor